MCLHGKREIEKAFHDYANHQEMAILWWEQDGVPKYGECVHFEDEQHVANTLRNIREWHSEDMSRGAWVPNLADVNGKRVAKGLSILDPDGLPEPNGMVPPSSDAERLNA